jgi:hypothetical protein
VNSYLHGCSGTGKILHLSEREDVQRRLGDLRVSFPPKTTRQEDLLKTIAVSEVLEAKCQANSLALLDDAQAAAELQWDLNQRTAAEEILAKIAKTPALIRAQLEESPHGAALLIDRLTTLLQFLDGGPLPAVQQSYALDLLGVPTELRLPGRTILDPQPGQDAATVARTVLTQALAKLQAPALVQARAALDHRRRTQTMQGTPLKISKEMGLMKRYEAMHARRRREAWAELLQLRQATGNALPKVKQKPAARNETEPQERPQDQAWLDVLAAARKQSAPAAASQSGGHADSSKSSPAPHQGPDRDRHAERDTGKAPQKQR